MVQTGYADVNGAKLYYEEFGSGHPLVMVHAGIADHTMWDDQFPEFDKHYRTIRLDLRGYGNSEPAAGEFAHADDLIGFLDALHIERVYLMGCSIGGMTCMDVTLDHPDRVDALIMVASGPTGLNLDVPPEPKFAEVEKAWNAQDFDRVVELETQIWIDGAKRTPDQIDPKVREHAKAMNLRAINHERKELGTRRPPKSPSAAERLDELKLPVLIVYGDQDTPFTQAAAPYMEQHIRGAKRVLIPNTAHLPNMEQPAEFNRIVLDFLKNIG